MVSRNRRGSTSHLIGRSSPNQTVENIPTVPRRRDQAFNAYMEIVRTRYYGSHHQRTPNYYMKERLLLSLLLGMATR